jgi:hypothetical protein
MTINVTRKTILSANYKHEPIISSSELECNLKNNPPSTHWKKNVLIWPMKQLKTHWDKNTWIMNKSSIYQMIKIQRVTICLKKTTTHISIME